MSPELFDEIEEILWEIRITPLLKKRMASKKPHIEVKFEDLMDF
jgi:hypothetical protein